jgi:hypothetical protein
MSDVSTKLQQQAIDDMVSHALTLTFGTLHVSRETVTLAREHAATKLRTFITDCTTSAKVIAEEEEHFAAATIAEPEVNFWRMFTSFTRTNMIDQGKALGLSSETATAITTVLLSHHGH